MEKKNENKFVRESKQKLKQVNKNIRNYKNKVKMKKTNPHLYKISNIIKESEEKLKEINKIFIDSDIEFEINRKSSIPAFLWQEEKVAQYHFFITVVGIIDARLDYIEDSIRFEEKFTDQVNKSDKLLELYSKKRKYLEERDIVVKNFLDITGYNEIDVIKEVIKEYPMYANFNKILEDASEHHHQLSLHYEMIKSYSTGQIESLYFSPEEILDEYKILYEDLEEYKDYNKQRLEKVKKSHKKEK